MSACELTASAVTLGLGAAEGYALARSGLFLPSTVRSAFELNSYGLAKVLLSAAGAAMVAQGVYSLVKPTEFAESRSYSKSSKPTIRLVAGGAIAGAGMALAGTTSHLFPVQLGAGVKSALTVLGGALVGGVIYSFAEKPLFDEVSSPEFKDDATAPATLDKILGVDYAILAIPLGIAIYACALALEHYHPHTVDSALKVGHVKLPAALPVVAGTIVGLSQLPGRCLTKCSGSTANPLNRILGTLSLGNVCEKFRINSIGDAIPLLAFAGSVLGAFLAQRRHVPKVLAAPGYDAQHSFLGGALIAVGAGVAGGCLGQQMVAGVPELAVPSAIAVLSTIISAMATTAMLKRI